MAIIVETTNPSLLILKIKEEIGNKKILTWEVDDDGDFVHTPPQWKYKAWFRPAVSLGALTLKIFPPNNAVITRAVYGAYHSHFLEMLLNHFDLLFTVARISALPTAGDIVQTPASS